jgi:hypothetical protein
MGKMRLLVVAALATMPILSGCTFTPFAAVGSSMGIYTPIPVPPWVTERMMDKYCYEQDFQTVIMPPIPDGFPPPICEDPPDEARILRALGRPARGLPFFYEEFRDDIQIVTERLVDKIDPPRFFPLVGPAQLHHCHWKCSIYYTETIETGWPFPFRCKRPRVKVVYIDLDHLHLYPHGNQQTNNSVFRDLAGP